MAFTYIVLCSDGTYYVGSTVDLERRLSEHNLGLGAEYTRRRRPVRLVWAAEFSSIRTAYELEKQVQGWSRAKRQALIDGRLEDLPRLARTAKPVAVVSTGSTDGGAASGTARPVAVVSTGSTDGGGECVRRVARMIFICVKWKVKPEHADAWPDLTREFTEATRAEEGNLFFDWSRSIEDPNEYVLVEAFKDDAAEAHVTSAHFRKAQAELPQYVQETPLIRNVVMDGDHWDRLGEFAVG